MSFDVHCECVNWSLTQHEAVEREHDALRLTCCQLRISGNTHAIGRDIPHVALFPAYFENILHFRL